MTRPLSYAAVLLAVWSPAVVSAVPVLAVRSNGADALAVGPGDAFELQVDLSGLGAELAVSASFEVTFTAAGLGYDGYLWTLPFDTGAGDDLSAPPLAALPVLLSEDLFGGAGSAVDVHFDNFASSGGVGNGPLTTLTMHVPADFPAPSTVTINVVPGDFVFSNSPFAMTPAGGTPLVLQVSAAAVVDVALVAVDSPTSPEQGALPPGLTETCIGGPLLVEIWVSQVDGGTEGVAGGSVDLHFANAALTAEAIDHGGVFVNQTSGTLDNALGLVDDLGGVTPNPGVGVAPDWALLARVTLTATGPGPAQLSMTPGSLAFALSGANGPLDAESQVTLAVPADVVVTAITLPGDTDCDNDVDLDDFTRFHDCVTGPLQGNPGPLSAGCALVDLEGDGDVDMVDFAMFQAGFGASP